MTEYDRIKGLSLEELTEELVRPSDNNMYYVCSDGECYCIYKDALHHQRIVLGSPKEIDEDSSFDDLIGYALLLIDDYITREFGYEGNYTNLSSIDLAYTTITDDKIPIQVSVDLSHYSIVTYLYGTIIRVERYTSLYELICERLTDLCYDSLIYVSDEELSKVQK